MLVKQPKNNKQDLLLLKVMVDSIDLVKSTAKNLKVINIIHSSIKLLFDPFSLLFYLIFIIFIQLLVLNDRSLKGVGRISTVSISYTFSENCLQIFY